MVVLLPLAIRRAQIIWRILAGGLPRYCHSHPTGCPLSVGSWKCCEGKIIRALETGISLKAIAKIKMEKERWLVLCSARYTEGTEYGSFGKNVKRGLLFINAVTASNSFSLDHITN